MVWFINARVKTIIDKEMHQQSYRRGNKFAGILVILFIMIGAIILFGINMGIYGEFTWIFSPIVIIFVLMVTVFGLSSRNKRIRRERMAQRTAHSQSPYQVYEPPTMKKEETEPASSMNYKYRNSYEKQFCDFCGIKLESEEQTFCVNCGQRLK